MKEKISGIRVNYHNKTYTNISWKTDNNYLKIILKLHKNYLETTWKMHMIRSIKSINLPVLSSPRPKASYSNNPKLCVCNNIFGRHFTMVQRTF